MGQIHAVVESRKLRPAETPTTYGGGRANSVPFGRGALTRQDLEIQDNRKQAAWELHRALENGGDAALLTWAKAWAEPAMREVLRAAYP